MKNLFFLFFMFTSCVFAQNSASKSLENTPEIAFEVVEHVPIYKGCNKKLSNIQLKKCMGEKISKHIAKNYKTNLVKGLGLPNGITTIHINFKVNQKGIIEAIKAKADHVVLEQEAERVIKKIPKMTRPGIVRGNPVIVPYSLPIKFIIAN